MADVKRKSKDVIVITEGLRRRIPRNEVRELGD